MEASVMFFEFGAKENIFLKLSNSWMRYFLLRAAFCTFADSYTPY
jgi:hypothetical protein